MEHVSKKIKVAIIGASGYSGVELVKILLKHPGVELARVIGASTVGQRLDSIYPIFRKKTDLVMEPFQMDVLKTMDVVFLALPHGEAMKQAPELLDAGIRVIDFSGDFRFKSPELYEKWYDLPHTAPAYLDKAVYGLPELFKNEIKNCQFVANPGCYPTSAILALAPVFGLEYVATDAITIASMSGTSGAGKKAKLDLIFSEVNETVKAYRVGNHQHTPEIKTILERVAGKDVNLAFVPHLLPITRGIYTTIALPLKQAVTRETVLKAYQEFYRDAAFVRILEDRAPEIKFVNDTNFCDISVAVDITQKFVIINATIDNLIKGAAGQAVQNMNLMAGFAETEGL